MTDDCYRSNSMSSFRRIRPIAVLAAAGLMGAALASPASATTLTVGVDCLPLGHGRVQCAADAEGGTGPYTFSWTPAPSSGGGSGGLAIIGCPRYQYRTISVVVTDANNDTANASGYFYCGDDAV
jgi:hypothetical protein